jgi:predicted nucleic acid-binding protein
VIYLDSSALVKLALAGPETAALARWLAERADQPLISSALFRAEVPRAVWRAEPGALPRSYRVLKRIARVALTPDVLDNSATLPPQNLSAAQAIHLASALAVKRDLTAFVAYDERLLAAAKDAGLPVAAPGSRLAARARRGAGGTRRARSEKKELSVQPMGGLHRLLRAQDSKRVLRAAVARTPRGRARVRP